MTVDEAVRTATNYTFGVEVTIRGWLVVAKGIAYLASSAMDGAAGLEPGVLVSDPRVPVSVASSDLAKRIGSIVALEAEAEATGALIMSPLPAFPRALVGVKRLLVEHEGRELALEL